jgi:putative flavoprotein involved in K+ transport
MTTHSAHHAQDNESIAATSIDTVVIGAGQAGLAMGHHLQRAGRQFVIVDADARVGDGWRQRYDSLRLFSLPKYASLPGWPIPVDGYATRDEMAGYLEAYAARFALPVRMGTRVNSVIAEDGLLRVSTSAGDYLARNVIVATGMHRRSILPAFAAELDPSIRQLTSLQYRNVDQFAPGPVLVVGAANSGTDIALDAAAAGHETYLARRHPGQVPFDIDDARGRRIVVPIVMFMFRHVLTLRTPMGRKARTRTAGHGVNLVRNKLADLDSAGITRVGRIESVRDGRPVPSEGRLGRVNTVVWCTGSGPDHRFLEVPVFDADGMVMHRRGVSNVPGLFFLGLHFQFALASAQIQGVDRDARYLLKRLRNVPELGDVEHSLRGTGSTGRHEAAGVAQGGQS